MKKKHINDDHIRSEAEMQLQLEGLIEIYDIFKTLKIQMFLSSGTMLGAVRGGDFISWDWNIGVACKAEEFNHKLKEFLQLLSEHKFEPRLIQQGDYIRINAIRYGICYIIENMVLIGHWITRRHYKGPAHFFDTYEMFKIRGIEFPCPAPGRDACAWLYGPDWQTPKHVKHRNQVINPEHKITKKDGLRGIVKRLMK
jgi:hypothetical protein